MPRTAARCSRRASSRTRRSSCRARTARPAGGLPAKPSTSPSAPDGATVTNLVANENVQVDLPPEGDTPARRIRSASLLATGAPEGHPGRDIFRAASSIAKTARRAASCRRSTAPRIRSHGHQDEAGVRRYRAAPVPQQRRFTDGTQTDGGGAERRLRDRAGPPRAEPRRGRHGTRSARLGRPHQRRGAQHPDGPGQPGDEGRHERPQPDEPRSQAGQRGPGSPRRSAAQGRGGGGRNCLRLPRRTARRQGAVAAETDRAGQRPIQPPRL